MRRRRAAEVVKQLDAFPKVPEDYQKPSARGGTFSILSLSLILILVVSEFLYYMDSQYRFRYSVDTDMDSKLLVTLDITIGMPCQYLGADIVDLAGESQSLATHMKMEPALFELSDLQANVFKAKQYILSRFSESRSLNDFLMIENFKSLDIPSEPVPKTQASSCRIHGSINVKKVAGNLHVTIGRSVPHPQGHAHLNVFVPPQLVNFSHRIDHFSFGPPVLGAINPLDATLKVTQDRQHVFQYFLRVVRTKFNTYNHGMTTNQYSVTEQNRTINHMQGSHGIPGVFFKYDMSSMMVEIKEERKPFWQFLVRLSGIIGGIFATSGMIHTFIGSCVDGALCRLVKRGVQDNHELDNSVASTDSSH